MIQKQNWNAERFENDYQSFQLTLNSMTTKPEIKLCLPVPVYKTEWGINDSTLVNGVIPAIKLASKNNLSIIDLYSEILNQHKNFPRQYSSQ